MDDPFFDGIDELYQRAKFGEDRATRAGCSCKNVVFVTMFFVCHAPSRSAVRSRGAWVRTSIALQFMGRFRQGSQ